MARLLVVEDDEVLGRAIERVLSLDGHEVTKAPTARRARELFRAASFDRAVLDVSLPDGDGLDLLRWMRLRALPTTALVLTGLVDRSLSARAFLLDASLVHKPIRADVLLRFARGRGLVETTRSFADEHGLSPRQTELLLAIVRGTPRGMLGPALDVRENTVKTMVRQILQKTDSRSIDQLRCRLLALAERRAS